MSDRTTIESLLREAELLHARYQVRCPEATEPTLFFNNAMEYKLSMARSMFDRFPADFPAIQRQAEALVTRLREGIEQAERWLVEDIRRAAAGAPLQPGDPGYDEMQRIRTVAAEAAEAEARRTPEGQFAITERLLTKICDRLDAIATTNRESETGATRSVEERRNIVRETITEMVGDGSFPPNGLDVAGTLLSPGQLLNRLGDCSPARLSEIRQALIEELR